MGYVISRKALRQIALLLCLPSETNEAAEIKTRHDGSVGTRLWVECQGAIPRFGRRKEFPPVTMFSVALGNQRAFYSVQGRILDFQEITRCSVC